MNGKRSENRSPHVAHSPVSQTGGLLEIAVPDFREEDAVHEAVQGALEDATRVDGAAQDAVWEVPISHDLTC